MESRSNYPNDIETPERPWSLVPCMGWKLVGSAFLIIKWMVDVWMLIYIRMQSVINNQGPSFSFNLPTRISCIAWHCGKATLHQIDVHRDPEDIVKEWRNYIDICNRFWETQFDWSYGLVFLKSTWNVARSWRTRCYNFEIIRREDRCVKS